MKVGRRRAFNVHSPYKKVAKTLRFGSSPYTVHTMLKVPHLRKATLFEVAKVMTKNYFTLIFIVNNLYLYTRLSELPSLLRISNVQQLTQFHWDPLIKELLQRAPTLMAMLKAAAITTRIARANVSRTRELQVITIAAALLLKQRNQHMAILQALVASILYAGYAAKRVWYFMNVVLVVIPNY